MQTLSAPSYMLQKSLEVHIAADLEQDPEEDVAVIFLFLFFYKENLQNKPFPLWILREDKFQFVSHIYWSFFFGAE